MLAEPGGGAHREARERVPASPEMKQYFGLDDMASLADAQAWFEGVWRRYAFETAAVDYFRTLRLEIGSLDEPLGGGYWFGDRNLVLLRGVQDEAALHELAHAWWERERAQQRDALMTLLRQLGDRPPAEYPRIAELANVYCQGIRTQVDPNSPTGYWRGMLAEDNDHETFAGFCSGVMGDASLLPPRLRTFYRGFLAGSS